MSPVCPMEARGYDSKKQIPCLIGRRPRDRMGPTRSGSPHGTGRAAREPINSDNGSEIGRRSIETIKLFIRIVKANSRPKRPCQAPDVFAIMRPLASGNDHRKSSRARRTVQRATRAGGGGSMRKHMEGATRAPYNRCSAPGHGLFAIRRASSRSGIVFPDNPDRICCATIIPCRCTNTAAASAATSSN